MSTQIGCRRPDLRPLGDERDRGTSVPDTAGQNVDRNDLWRSRHGCQERRSADRGRLPIRPPSRLLPTAPRVSPLAPTLDVTVSDPDDDPMNVTFYGRPATGTTPPDFTIGMVPDTQWYSENAPDAGVPGGRITQYNAQMQWLVDTRSSYNTQFVTHMGDIVQNIDAQQAEWIRADAAQDILDNNDVPNSVAPGNHDISTRWGRELLRPVLPPEPLPGRVLVRRLPR